MKILVYENSAGFSSYTHKLCNALIAEAPDAAITYMTEGNNREIQNLSPKICLKSVLESYSSRKKNSAAWLVDRVMVSLRNIKTRNREAKQGAYDVISIQATIPVIDQFYMGKLRKYAKVVYTVHDVIPPLKSFYYSKGSLKKLYRTADRLIVHSGKNREQLISLFGIDPQKISVVHHGTEVEYQKYDPAACREKFGISKEKTVFLFYGLIREQKGLADLIDAMKDIPRAQLVIAGAVPHGETFDAYEQQLQNNGIDCVRFIQYIPNEWTDELYQACDAVCLPYRYFYSQSGVFMQSIQYRKPVLVTDVAAFGEYLSKYHMGLLAQPADVSDIHEKLLQMQQLLSGDSAHFAEGMEQAAHDNSWQRSAQCHLDIFKEIL